MKNIYIVLTYTGTVISKLIKLFTKDEYCHSSIALDVDLEGMYSFGRKYTFTPLIAGFVHEYIDKGTFKRFYKTQAKVMSMQVTDEQYEKIKDTIKQFEKEKEKYKFNMIGLCSAGVNIKIKPKNYFYCAEFVQYILQTAGIEMDYPKIIKPEFFKQREELKEVYTGLLQEYNSSEVNIIKLLTEGIFIYKNKEESTL